MKLFLTLIATAAASRRLQDAAPANATEEVVKIIDPGVHVKEATLFDYIGLECNKFFRNSGTVVAPWPDNCKVFKTDECSSYEISRDGKSVDSCEIISQIPEVTQTGCSSTKLVNECIEFYEGAFIAENEDGEQLRFPDTGAQCLFKESLFPIKPW